MKRALPEAQLQRAVAHYLTLVLRPDVVWTAIGHGGGGAVRGAQLKSMGLRRGVADLFITWKTYFSPPMFEMLWIEFKSKKGVQSSEQFEFQTRVEAIGHQYLIIRDLDDLQRALRARNVPMKSARAA